MHPAYSVLLFTTISGAGYGLLFALGLGLATGLLPASGVFGFTTMAIALVLITTGLLSSAFHLGHPERAWRAFSQWRSSWLSREGVAAVATYLPAVPLTLLWGFVPDSPWLPALAVLSAAGAVVTVFCTGCIYSSLPTIPEWRHWLTTPLYLLFALASGLLILSTAVVFTGTGHPGFVTGAALSMLVATAVKLVYWVQIGSAQSRALAQSGAPGQPPASSPSPSGMHPLDRPGAAADAIGLDPGTKVTLLDPPHTSDNYLMREMGYRVARKHAVRLRKTALLFAVVAIMALIFCAGIGSQTIETFFVLIALVSGMAGVLIERWLFFAEARHIVRLYYGEGTT